MEEVLLPVCLVRDSRVVAKATEHPHLIDSKARLHTEGASGPTLAGKTVTDGDSKRVARDFQSKLATVTGGMSVYHRGES
jgi:hypothetical protein